VDFHGEELDRGGVVVFWSRGDTHRMIVPSDYSEARELFKRMLSRFRGGRRFWTDCQSQLMRLSEPGCPLSVSFGNQVVGLVRVWQRGPDAIDRPVMLCRPTGRTAEVEIPVLLPSIAHARNFARRLKAYGVSTAGWRCYEGQHQETAAEKLFSTGLGGVTVRTELEAELVAAFGPAGRARQALPPLEIPGIAPTH
jgi:hypothetical protein